MISHEKSSMLISIAKRKRVEIELQQPSEVDVLQETKIGEKTSPITYKGVITGIGRTRRELRLRAATGSIILLPLDNIIDIRQGDKLTVTK